jgi:hypothetical protein
MKTSILILIASLLVALVPWFNALATWGAISTPVNVGAVLGIVGGVLLAWLGASPIPPKSKP